MIDVKRVVNGVLSGLVTAGLTVLATHDWHLAQAAGLIVAALYRCDERQG